MNAITLALTHFNRFPLLLECIERVMHDPRITEIVISDDASTDGSYELLLDQFAYNARFKLFRNEKNLDCYANKAAAVARATNPWVILFDSDNILPVAYVDKLHQLPEWDPGVVYCPDFAEPHFDYTAFSDLEVTSENVSALMGREVDTRMVTRKGIRFGKTLAPRAGRFRCALNTCNYFVHRESYLKVWDGSVDPHTADSIFQVLNWLRSGRRLKFVKGLRYFHRIHDGSHYKLNNHLTGSFMREVEERLIQLR